MKLAHYDEGHGGIEAGLVLNERELVPLTTLPAGAEFASIDELLEAGPAALDRLRQELESRLLTPGLETIPLATVKLRPPVLRPRRLFAVAANFADHVREGGGEPPPKEGRLPLVFVKIPASLIGSGDTLELPISSRTVDWEIELAAVIGTRVKYAGLDEAGAAVAGYAVFNDLSARTMEYPERTQPPDPTTEWFDFLNGKWFDGSASLGPWLTTADEIDDPLSLAMHLDVNGVRRQESTSAEMIFGPEEVISFISRWSTLDPGDVIALGTPAGCGFATGTYLRSGDVIRAEIAGLGVLENYVVDRS